MADLCFVVGLLTIGFVGFVAGDMASRLSRRVLRDHLEIAARLRELSPEMADRSLAFVASELETYRGNIAASSHRCPLCRRRGRR